MTNISFTKVFRNKVSKILAEGSYEKQGGMQASDVKSNTNAAKTFEEEYANLAYDINMLLMDYEEILNPNIPENSQIKRMYRNVEKMSDIMNGYGAEAYNQHI